MLQSHILCYYMVIKTLVQRHSIIVRANFGADFQFYVLWLLIPVAELFRQRTLLRYLRY
jgi:hypothetical protein